MASLITTHQVALLKEPSTGTPQVAQVKTLSVQVEDVLVKLGILTFIVSLDIDDILVHVYVVHQT
jgi:hypothetical protein